MTQTGRHFRQSIQIALTHFFFNLSGLMFWYILPPLRRLPLSLSKKVGRIVSNHRWFAMFYVFLTFFFIPMSLCLTTLIHWLVTVILLSCIILVLVCFFILNYLQNVEYPQLPIVLRSWSFLPMPCRSLTFWDNYFQRFGWIQCTRLRDPLKKQLKNRYVKLKDEYLTMLNHRFLTQTHQLDQVFEKYHAPLVKIYQSQNSMKNHLQNFYLTMTGQPTLQQRALTTLMKSHLISNDENMQEENDVIDRIFVFDRNRFKESDLNKTKDTSF